MSRQEILSTSYGEMMDLIACLSIYQGTTEQKVKPVEKPMEDILAMR